MNYETMKPKLILEDLLVRFNNMAWDLENKMKFSISKVDYMKAAEYQAKIDGIVNCIRIIDEELIKITKNISKDTNSNKPKSEN